MPPMRLGMTPPIEVAGFPAAIALCARGAVASAPARGEGWMGQPRVDAAARAHVYVARLREMRDGNTGQFAGEAVQPQGLRVEVDPGRAAPGHVAALGLRMRQLGGAV